ncbi:LLM class flavin-dependent oxidoreductase [Paractinoplanes ferrugineus]|uniref:Alkanesulfonate monooxygenase n=1 Tax=Paractinoplanes ferrugineus TaxID=113564 RepID=A0A919J4L9_9ACTN|nr:LLM class flavin-dependent oxidoreductase [Actinoplanes ferrugineus]GIE13267.1 alkanesulfonate monooxygenase [Actinoplanes ferrugineus]
MKGPNSPGRDNDEFALYTQGPPGTAADPLASLTEAARLADHYGYTGMLLFYNHRSLEPWLLASALIHCTPRLVPLIALQPYAVPPTAAAKMAATLAKLYGRRIDINLIAGADPAELAQIGDTTEHDARYARATEYVQVLRNALESDEPFSHAGEHYRFDRLFLNAFLEPGLRPRVLVAGSSPAGRETAAAVADVTVTHPDPVGTFSRDFAATAPPGAGIGIRIGVLARPTAEQAWNEARARYPIDRAAIVRTRLKQKSPSEWTRRLAVLAAGAETYDEVYWTGAFTSGASSFPLLVGDYEQVGAYLGQYHAAGVRTVLAAGVNTADDYRHADQVFSRFRDGRQPSAFSKLRE